MLICMQMVIYTHLIQPVRVLSEYDYISVSDCYSIYIPQLPFFHFPEWCGDPSVSLFHHD